MGEKMEVPEVNIFKKPPLEEDDVIAQFSTTNELKKLSLREKWKDRVFRHKVIYSMFMSASFSSLGMYLGQHGPTFLDIQLITKTDLEEGSAFFTGGNAGHLTGCIITGLIYSKMNPSLLQFIVTIGMGLTNMALPYCSQFELMIFMRFISAAFGGGIANGLNTGHLALWGSEGNGLLQFSHFVFSVGGMLSPMFAEPFLVDKLYSLEKTNTTTATTTGATNASDLHSSTTTLRTTTAIAPESRVKYVFIITGIFAVITAIPFIIIFLRGGKKRKASIQSETIRQRNIPTVFIISLLTGLCLFEMLYVSLETTHFNFLMTFLVEEFGISKSKGAIVTAIGWGSFALARFIMIFMTKKFTSLQLLIMLSILLVASQCATAIAAHLHIVNLLIVFTAISAFAMSGIFPAGLSWAEKELFHVTGIFTSCVVVSSSLGAMVNPLFLGFLMEQRSNMWFCFLLLAEACAMCITLIVMLVFSRYYVDRKFGGRDSQSHLNMTREIKSGINGEVAADSDAQEKLCSDG